MLRILLLEKGVREREREKYPGSVVANDDVFAVHGALGLQSSGGMRLQCVLLPFCY